MATLNLGRIKPVFRGAYAGGTAYVVDDIVTSGGETFICIQSSTGNATSNATYWTKLAEKGTNGTNGTDVGTTLTTQGDILYRDGSGLQRLPKGTANQELRINSGATAPEWFTPATASSDFVLLATSTASSTGEMLFDGHFSSTYDTYKVIFYDVYNSASSHLAVRFMKSGSSITSNYYKSVVHHVYTDSTPSNSASTSRVAWGSNLMPISTGDYPAREADSARIQGEITLFNPLSTSTKKTIQTRVSYQRTGDANTMHLVTGYGRLEDNTNALSGINITGNSGNFVTGKFKLYGIK